MIRQSIKKLKFKFRLLKIYYNFAISIIKSMPKITNTNQTTDEMVPDNRSTPANSSVNNKYPIYCMTCGDILTDIWFECEGMEAVPVSKSSIIACKECSPTGRDRVAHCEIVPKQHIVWM